MYDRFRKILGRIVRKHSHFDLPYWSATEASSPFTVPNVMPWLFHAEGRDFEVLARFLADLMKKIRPRDWTRLYSEFRAIRLSPNQVDRLRDLPPDVAVEVLGAATLSANGYAREAALRSLAEIGLIRGLPFVLLRLGDWVGQVRAAALMALRALLRPDAADEILAYYHLVDRLTGIQRVDCSEVLEEIRRFLLAKESRSALSRALASKHAPHRLLAYRMLENELDEGAWKRSAKDRDPSIRLWVVLTWLRSRAVMSADLMRRLLCDKASVVCVTMIRTLSQEQVAQFQDIIIESAFADSLTVREAARFALRGMNAPDLASEARRRLAATDGSDVSPGVVAGLGETGENGDCELIAPLLDSSRSRVREAALRSLARLGGETFVEQIVPFLDDSTGRVRRSAARALMEMEPSVWVTAVRRVFRTSRAGGQKQALVLLARRNGWNPVPDFLSALHSEYPEVCMSAWQCICEWIKTVGIRGWIKPSAATLNELSILWPSIRRLALDAPQGARREWNELRRLLECELQTLK